MVKTTLIAGFLSAILAGEYTPKTLSAEQQDSILAIGNQSEEYCRYRLESENENRIFRRSSTADWYIIDTQKNNKRTPLGKNLGQVRDAVMSPNGRYIAFAKDNNLYIHKLDFGTEVAVTKDEDPDVINGIADWLYEEEFGTTALFAWSPDSKQLAFVRLDEHEVPSFSWQYYLANHLSPITSDQYPQYPTADTLRYPKAGCKNAKASVCVYDVATKAIHGSQTSAHTYGLAVDCQPYFTSSDKVKRVNEFAAYIKAFLSANRSIQFDQILVERNNSGGKWVHIGYKNRAYKQRRQFYADFDANGAKGSHKYEAL